MIRLCYDGGAFPLKGWSHACIIDIENARFSNSSIYLTRAGGFVANAYIEYGLDKSSLYFYADRTIDVMEGDAYAIHVNVLETELVKGPRVIHVNGRDIGIGHSVLWGENIGSLHLIKKCEIFEICIVSRYYSTPILTGVPEEEKTKGEKMTQTELFDELEEYIGTTEAAELLGTARGTVDYLIKSKMIPHTEVKTPGGFVRYKMKRGDVLTYREMRDGIKQKYLDYVGEDKKIPSRKRDVVLDTEWEIPIRRAIKIIEASVFLSHNEKQVARDLKHLIGVESEHDD